jgi:hypothetical protein
VLKSVGLRVKAAIPPPSPAAVARVSTPNDAVTPASTSLSKQDSKEQSSSSPELKEVADLRRQLAVAHLKIAQLTATPHLPVLFQELLSRLEKVDLQQHAAANEIRYTAMALDAVHEALRAELLQSLHCCRVATKSRKEKCPNKSGKDIVEGYDAMLDAEAIRAGVRTALRGCLGFHSSRVSATAPRIPSPSSDAASHAKDL